MQPWLPRMGRCEFCNRKVLPNAPGQSDQWIYVGPARGQERVVACMSWRGLKPGKQPCGIEWRHMDERLKQHGKALDESKAVAEH